MRMCKAFLGAAMLAAAMAGPVQAKMAEFPSYNWSGFYIGGGVGVHWLDGDVDLNGEKTKKKQVDCVDVVSAYDNHYTCIESTSVYGPFPFNSSGDLDGDASVFGTIIGGFDWQSRRHPRIVFGAFIDADFGDADADFDLSISTYGRRIGSAQGQLELDYLFTVAGRIGVLSPDQKTLAYALVGWTHAEFDNGSFEVRVNPGHGFPSVLASGKLPDEADGVTVGGGVESKLTDKLSLRLEARATFFGSESSNFSGWAAAEPYDGTKFYYGPEGCGGGDISSCQEKITKQTDVDGSINIDPDLYSFRAVLTYKFGRQHAAAPLK